MKRILWFAAAALSMLFTFVSGGIDARAEGEQKKLDVMFLHDVHSHLESFKTVKDGEPQVVGGFARIKTLIDQQKSVNPDTLILDGGDFSMGTLVQTVFEQQAAELRMFGHLGVDVTVLGNHEFDYRSKGLANMLTAAAASGDAVPQLVICNIDWEAMEAVGLTTEQQMLKESFESYGVKDYTVITKGDVRIAVIGVFGDDALMCAPTCSLLFRDQAEAVAETVKEIKANESVDMIVCVSHSGVWEDKKKSEDELLAKAVPEIDLIVSGHTHTELNEPIRVGSTYIVSCGEYGKNLGSLSMTQRSDGRWDMSLYQIIPVTESIQEDEETVAKVGEFLDLVDSIYLADFSYTQEQVLADNDIGFCTVNDLYTKHEELNLGSIISDAYRYVISQTDDGDPNPVSMAVVPSGTVRETYAKGQITVKDVFNSFSLGIGEDGVPGYPLISVYLTGRELRAIAEIDASISDYYTSARLYMSGLNMEYNPHRLILSKVTECYLEGSGGEREEIENRKLYRIVTDLYTGQMLGSITDMSFGIISIVPKNVQGQAVESLEELIVTADGKELKAWDAIARYMQSFEDTDGNGIGNVPAYYDSSHGRKVVNNSRNIVDLLKNPSRYVVMIIAIVLVVLIILIVGTVLIVRLVKKRRKKFGNN